MRDEMRREPASGPQEAGDFLDLRLTEAIRVRVVQLGHSVNVSNGQRSITNVAEREVWRAGVPEPSFRSTSRMRTTHSP